MKRPLLAAAALAALFSLSGCPTVAGTMIGAGVGTLAGHPVSGAMIGGGVGMLVDFRGEASAPEREAQNRPAW